MLDSVTVENLSPGSDATFDSPESEPEIESDEDAESGLSDDWDRSWSFIDEITNWRIRRDYRVGVAKMKARIHLRWADKALIYRD